MVCFVAMSGMYADSEIATATGLSSRGGETLYQLCHVTCVTAAEGRASAASTSTSTQLGGNKGNNVDSSSFQQAAAAHQGDHGITVPSPAAGGTFFRACHQPMLVRGLGAAALKAVRHSPRFDEVKARINFGVCVLSVGGCAVPVSVLLACAL